VISHEEFSSLLAAAQRGDDRAMAALFTDVHPKVVRFVRAREKFSADDIVGEIWLGVARGLRNFEGDAASFRAWVFTIARHRIADPSSRRPPRRSTARPRGVR
jgi:RNA polymerase sigma-70 factor (ECF subfamily)